jgi:hypothetical protein
MSSYRRQTVHGDAPNSEKGRQNGQTNSSKKELQAEFTHSTIVLDRELSKTNNRLEDLENLVPVRNTTDDLMAAMEERTKDHIEKKFDKSCVDGQSKLSFASVVVKR